MYFLKKYRLKWIVVSCFLIVWFFSLSRQLFQDPLSLVLLDKNEQLLGARIATDGQWRFPQIDTLPSTFIDCITTFEDKRFFNHFGFDPIGFGRAMKQNIKAREIVSGGSTLSMQVIRLSRKGKSRTVFEKIIEIFLATRLELTYSKEEILKLYATYAPFGGNVVGLETAAWRYFGRAPQLLTWSEHATLAVLPNAPSLIHFGRNRKALFKKRNRLLDRLLQNGKIDTLTCQLSKEEELPAKPFRLPQFAPHLLNQIHKEFGKSQKAKVQTNIDIQLQKQVNEIIDRHHNQLKFNEIRNAAAIVLDVETGNTIAYVGNAINAGKEHGRSVDIITSPRSTGSILKPFLYALALEDGLLTPEQLLTDIPIAYGDYQPENYQRTYDGVASAKTSIARSLNIPMVNLLHEYSVPKFHSGLQKLGLTTINRPPEHYGLTLILGGAEATLGEITAVYANMARGVTLSSDPLNGEDNISYHKKTILSPAAKYHSLSAMREVERPTESGDWERFGGSQQIAWKTGTSFGFRDAWAVGVTAKYAVGVWVGNADGEGRPGLVGVKAAAPILFDIFEKLPPADWFDPPYDEMVQMPICKNSGMRALDICPRDTQWIIPAAQKANGCTFHKLVHLDAVEQFQVTNQCVASSEMIHKGWFVLPPVPEYYYKQKNPDYKPLPKFKKGCVGHSAGQPMQLIYPLPSSKILLPIDLDGTLKSTVFKAAHREENSIIYWHLDEQFVGETSIFHHLELKPEPGSHQITLVDEQGSRLTRRFEVIGRNEN